MDFRLSRGGSMLGDLLGEELSETHLGLSTGARAHLDRFRTHVHDFYATRFGSFPPPAADPRCSTVFQPEAYLGMKGDFEALYHYLVDTSFTTTDNAPSEAQGGLCALQSVHEFDLRHKFAPLDHPLPLLPAPLKAKESRRRSMPWFLGGMRSGERLRPEQRLGAHAALLQATNHTDADVLANDLVTVYRAFEEASIMELPKGAEVGVMPGDARKVRWLFIYAMYQTLRSCADVPKQVRYASNVGYHLGVSIKGAPPWQAQERGRSATSDHGQDMETLRPGYGERDRSIVAVPLLSPMVTRSPKGFEIRPDIDYFALTHQETPTGQRSPSKPATTMPRSRSQSLTRNMSLRHSLNIFRNSTQRCVTAKAISPSRPSWKSRYHEIIVHGYGNGTNAVHVSPETPLEDLTQAQAPRLPVITTSRPASTSSRASSASKLSASPSTAALSVASTTPTTLGDPQSPTSNRYPSESWKSTHTHDAQPLPSTPPRQKAIRRMHSSGDPLLDAPPVPPPVPRRSSKRVSRRGRGGVVPKMEEGAGGRKATNKRWSLVEMSASLREMEDEDDDESEAEADRLLPSPLRLRKGCDAHDVFERCEKRVYSATVWEQYGDLGGFKTVEVSG